MENGEEGIFGFPGTILHAGLSFLWAHSFSLRPSWSRSHLSLAPGPANPITIYIPIVMKIAQQWAPDQPLGGEKCPEESLH